MNNDETGVAYLPLRRWLERLPAASLNRLRTINTSTNSSKHVILSLAFGLYDRDIRRVNRVITALLLSRMKAERAGNAALVARINDLMNDIHAAIDHATGTVEARIHKSPSPCNSSMQTQGAR